MLWTVLLCNTVYDRGLCLCKSNQAAETDGMEDIICEVYKK